jgi:hypothetical protein
MSNTLPKKNKVTGLIVLDLKVYYKATILKTWCFKITDKQAKLLGRQSQEGHELEVSREKLLRP